jgi:ribosomal-protein-alanine N-acetyltransferase
LRTPFTTKSRRGRQSSKGAARAVRPLAVADAEELLTLRIANREFLAPFEPNRSTEHDTLAGVRAWIASGDGPRFAILEGDAIAGTISLSNVVRGAFQSANVGYWVDRERNRRGLATAAVAAVVRQAFDELGLHRLEAGTLLDNVASQRVLEKNGFEQVGIARGYLHIGGEWRDHVLFQLLAD